MNRHDDPVLKYQALTQVVEEFYKINGRSPTFWLDKVCLDQTAIQDSLKTLPVYLMSCNAMLVLAGDTYVLKPKSRCNIVAECYPLFRYVNRLWCVWVSILVYLHSLQFFEAAAFLLGASHSFCILQRARYGNLQHRLWQQATGPAYRTI